ncbi:MAG: peptide deformylase [Planctomycetota bacterium]|nr:peptide deformylase [Planctomycetota bacterium]
MAILSIFNYPQRILRVTSSPVREIDLKIRRLAADMIDTMIDANGLGLAAPQVGQNIRLAVVDFDCENHSPQVLINPVIIRRSREKEEAEEGCLSFPGIRGPVKRPVRVTCQALNLDGELVEYQCEDLTARAIQHEIDHLDGLLFIDKIGPSDRLVLREAIEDLESTFDTLHAMGGQN